METLSKVLLVTFEIEVEEACYTKKTYPADSLEILGDVTELHYYVDGVVTIRRVATEYLRAVKVLGEEVDRPDAVKPLVWSRIYGEAPRIKGAAVAHGIDEENI
jgi:hypothetical protein